MPSSAPGNLKNPANLHILQAKQQPRTGFINRISNLLRAPKAAKNTSGKDAYNVAASYDFSALSGFFEGGAVRTCDLAARTTERLAAADRFGQIIDGQPVQRRGLGVLAQHVQHHGGAVF